MGCTKRLALDLHENQVNMGKAKRDLKFFNNRIKHFRGLVDVMLDNCDGSLESSGYITDDKMELLVDTNKELVGVSLNRNKALKDVRFYHDHIEEIKLKLNETKGANND